MRQMTFDIPDDVAEDFESDVPFSERSGEVTQLIRHRRSRLTATEAEWAAACDAVNADPILNELIDDWQAACDPIEEPWDEPAPR